MGAKSGGEESFRLLYEALGESRLARDDDGSANHRLTD